MTVKKEDLAPGIILYREETIKGPFRGIDILWFWFSIPGGKKITLIRKEDSYWLTSIENHPEDVLIEEIILAAHTFLYKEIEIKEEITELLK